MAGLISFMISKIGQLAVVSCTSYYFPLSQLVYHGFFFHTKSRSTRRSTKAFFLLGEPWCSLRLGANLPFFSFHPKSRSTRRTRRSTKFFFFFVNLCALCGLVRRCISFFSFHTKPRSTLSFFSSL